MNKLIMIILTLVFIVIWGALWSLPLYLCVNFIAWLFNLSYHLTWLQAFGICWLASIVKGLFFTNNKEGK